MKKTKTTPNSLEASAPETDEQPKHTPASSPVETEVDAAPQESPASSSDNTELMSAIAELTNDLQRTRADFENFRKQVEAQKSQAMSAAKYATVQKFLPLVDDFSRAIETYPDQLSPLQKSLTKTLQSLGLTQVDSKPGTEFNPDFHEAVSVEDGEGDQEVVAETLRPGYAYDGIVIRTAMVKVKHQ